MNYLFSFALIWFSLFFSFFYFVFKKKVDKRILFFVFLFVLIALFNKTHLGLFAGNVDPEFHLNPENITYGFPLFFVAAFLFNFIGLDAFYFMLLFFGALTFYVFSIWASEKNVSYPVLVIALISISHFNYLFFSFSRGPVIIPFALLFLYFLEKKDFKWSLVFLAFACLTKVTGFLLIPLFVWFSRKQDRKLLSGILLAGIFLYGLFFTNLGSNLAYAFGFNLSLFSLSTAIFLLHAFPILSLTVLPFFNRKKFLWVVCFYALIMAWLYGFSSAFLLTNIEAHIDLTVRRYFVIFELPAVLWLSSEIDAFVRRKLEDFGVF